MTEIVSAGNNQPVVRVTKILKYDPKSKTVIESRPVLLLDISGSMATTVEKRRKIDILREAVQQNTGVRMFVFSDDIIEIFSEVPEPQSTTDMAYAFEYLHTRDIINKNTRFVVVSDGMPDSPDYTMQIAKQIEIPINTLYIGKKGDQGEHFMQLLAKMTGGSQLTAETLKAETFQKQLTTGITKLLLGK